MRDHKTLDEDTLAERYEKTLSRIKQIAATGYTVKLMWECKFDAAKESGTETRIINASHSEAQSPTSASAL